MRSEQYMQPIAVHRRHAERLLLRDVDGQWHLWTGEAAGSNPIEVPQGLGHYLMHRCEMEILPAHQRMWFVVGDLPLRADVAARSETTGWEYLA
ncbi:MAG: hypothetical protein M3173_06385 [Chloroflexota bacterium]|nr:hypothetical protein [Chloroflexota bacterium]